MTDPVAFTFLCLLAAHVAGDFLFQTKWMVEHKHTWQGMSAHIAIVAGTTLIALGGGHWMFFTAIVGTHATMDWIKTHYLPRTFWPFAVDQTYHIAVLICAAILIGPNLPWAAHADMLTTPLVLFTGFAIATYAGGAVIGLLMSGLHLHAPKEGIDGAGRIIGILERGLIFGLVYIGQPTGVGFLIAAKSVLRFETVKAPQASEYVIIGTLASFAWAFGAGYATDAILRTLAP